jgi:hypothetical protein
VHGAEAFETKIHFDEKQFLDEVQHLLKETTKLEITIHHADPVKMEKCVPLIPVILLE